MNNSFLIDIPNYNGPLETLFDLAKNQKVDLAEISISKLADQFLDFVKNNQIWNFRSFFAYYLIIKQLWVILHNLTFKQIFIRLVLKQI